MRPLVAVLAFVLGCTAAPTTPPPTSAGAAADVATPSPGEAATASCDEGRQRWLLETFFLGYNARTKGAAAVFRFGPSFQYYDSVDGEAVDLRDDGLLPRMSAITRSSGSARSGRSSR